MKVGIDLDNTLVDYDRVFCDLARENGLLPKTFAGTKSEVRDAVLGRPDGEREWMRLQGRIYGALMPRAEVVPGAREFIALCRARGAAVYIVSHKTSYGHFDPDRVNLHAAARAWLEANGFFGPEGIGLERDSVFFEATRVAKVARIASLGCTHFVDDLPEVFDEPGFPSATEALLLDRDSATAPRSDRIRVFRSFNDIAHALFPGSV